MAKQGLKITKFERDLYTEERRTNLLEDIVNVIAGTDFGTTDINRTGSRLEYEFFDAFPIAISSMPISYESSQLLKCTVSFSYTRYIINEISVGHVSKSSNVITGPSGSAAANEFFQQNRDSLINDTRGRSFSNPQDIINRFGGSTRLQEHFHGSNQDLLQIVQHRLINNHTEKLFGTLCLYQRLPRQLMNLSCHRQDKQSNIDHSL